MLANKCKHAVGHKTRSGNRHLWAASTRQRVRVYECWLLSVRGEYVRVCVCVCGGSGAAAVKIGISLEISGPPALGPLAL